MPTSNQTLQDVLKLVYLVPDLGEYAILPDGALTNIGGVTGPNFTVGGKPLLFADGTSTDGTVISILSPDLQKVYDNTQGEGFINCTTGKDFVLQAVNTKQFRFDADTGEVNITGDLIVHGTTTTIIHTSIETDRVAIRQTASDYVPFIIEPTVGVVPTANIVDIKAINNEPSVFTINGAGQTFIKDLSVENLNGVDIAALSETVTEHIETISPAIKHPARQISVAPGVLSPANNVQEALDTMAQKVAVLEQGGIATARGFEHMQSVASLQWTITHGGNTQRVQVQVWSATNELMFADVIKIVDNNTVTVSFNTAITGRAILMLF